MQNPSASVAQPIYPHLNLLRAFAALTVLVYHVIELGKWEEFPHTAGFWWFRTGWMAVDLFLVLSGFVITHSLLQWQAQGKPYWQTCREFLHRRVWRIAPLYLLTGACFLLLNDPSGWLREESLRRCLPRYLTFTQSFDRDCFSAINGVSWSVALEMQFYLLMAFTFPFWSRQKKWPWRLWIGVWIFALAAKEATWLLAESKEWSGFQRFHHMVRLPVVLEEFAVGMALALWRKPLSVPLMAVAALALGLILFPIYFRYSSYWDVQGMVLFWRTGLVLFFGLIVAIAINLPTSSTPSLMYRGGYYLGEISYGVYLWHGMVIGLLLQHTALRGEMLLLATLAIALPLSALTWHGVEKPLMAYSKRKSTSQ